MPDPAMTNTGLAATVHHSGGSYPVIAEWGLIDRLGETLLELGVKSPAYIITGTLTVAQVAEQVLALWEQPASAFPETLPRGTSS